VSKRQQSPIIKHWFSVDRILFGDKKPEVVLEKEQYRDYLTTKGALLSNLYEIYKKVDYNSQEKYNSLQELYNASIEKAEKNINTAKRIIKEESVSQIVKKEIQEVGLREGYKETEIARYVVLKRLNSIALDSLFFEGVITKSKSKNLNDIIGKTLVESHKNLRETLVELSV
jgi:putative cell wall-binding protein